MRPRSMPASTARRRASGVTVRPPGSRAGPKFFGGVRIGWNGSSGGTARAGSDRAGSTPSRRTDCGRRGRRFGRRRGAMLAELMPGRRGLEAARPPRRAPPPRRRPARPRPPARGSPSARRREVAGTSIDVLSVSISNRLSPGLTASPTDLNQVVILPSATVSPSCGIQDVRSVRAPTGQPAQLARRVIPVPSAWPCEPSDLRVGRGSGSRRRRCDIRARG